MADSGGVEVVRIVIVVFMVQLLCIVLHILIETFELPSETGTMVIPVLQIQELKHTRIK